MPVKYVDLPVEEAPTSDDLVVIRDNLTGTTRKVTLAKFFANPPLGNGAVQTAMIADGAVTKAKLAPDANITVRTQTQASPATLTPDVDNYDILNVTNLNSSMSIAVPTGTPVNGQGLMFRIKDSGAARALTWASGTNGYRAIGVTIPTATVASKLLYVSARYNAESLRWDVLSVGREA